MHKFIHRGQILVKGKYRYKKGRNVAVTVVEVDLNSVTYYTSGGGFQKSMETQEFLNQYVLMSDEEEKLFNAYRHGVAYFDTGENKGPGSTHQAWPCIANNSRWNGWAVPYFTKPIIDLLFKRQYLTEHGGFDDKGANVTPILWLEDKGYFFDNNIPDFIELSKIRHSGTNFYCIEGYCWDLIEPMDVNVEQFTQTFPFVTDSTKNQTDEKLVIEAMAWKADQFFSDDPINVEMVDHFMYLRDSGDALNWQQRQYVLNWLYRWESCDDA